MHCRAIACDYDGTGATDGHLAPEVAAALNRLARRASSLSSLPAASSTTCGSRSSTSRPSKRSSRKAARSCGTQRATARSSSALRPAMDSSAGCAPQVLPSTRARSSWRPGTPTCRSQSGRSARPASICSSYSIARRLPSGINRAVGTRRALDELGRSPRNRVAFGDAENALPLVAPGRARRGGSRFGSGRRRRRR